MNRQQFISFFFIALLVYVVYQVLLIFSPFFKAIFWSCVLTFAFYPLYVRLKRAIPRETPAALTMTAIILLVVIPPIVMLLITLTSQAVDLYQATSDYVRSGGIIRLVEEIRSWGFTRNIEEKIVQWEPLQENLTSWLLTTSRSVGNIAAGQAAIWTKNVFFLGLNLVFMAVLIFIFLKDGQTIYQYIYDILPLEEKHKRPVVERMNETFSAVIRGQLVTGLTQAVIAGLVFWILEIPAPILFATFTFLAALIPIVGASTVWGPLVVYLLTIDKTPQAIILFVFGALVISLIDNFMKPILIGEKTRLPYFLLFFGILGGLKLYGIAGIFIAPVVLSIFFALIKIYQEKTW